MSKSTLTDDEFYRLIDDEKAMDRKWKAVNKEVADFNRKSRRKAMAAFKAGPVPSCMYGSAFARNHMLRNIELVESGQAPETLVDCDRAAVVEMLHSRTYVEYMGKSLPEVRDESEFGSYYSYLQECMNALLNEGVWTGQMIEETDAYKKWWALFCDLRQYLHSAAALAKAVGSSAAARLYLRAWKILDDADIDDCDPCQAELTTDEAESVMRLERVAASLLQVDILYAKLQPYTPEKARKVTRTTKKAK